MSNLNIVNIVLATMILIVTTILTFAAIEAENKKSTNSSITNTKKLDHKTSTNCNSAETLLMPKPNGGFIPVLIPDPNCKENQDE